MFPLDGRTCAEYTPHPPRWCPYLAAAGRRGGAGAPPFVPKGGSVHAFGACTVSPSLPRPWKTAPLKAKGAAPSENPQGPQRNSRCGTLGYKGTRLAICTNPGEPPLLQTTPRMVWTPGGRIFATGSLSPSGLESQAAAGALALTGRPTAFHSNEGLNIFPLASFEQLAHQSRSNNCMVNKYIDLYILIG